MKTVKKVLVFTGALVAAIVIPGAAAALVYIHREKIQSFINSKILRRQTSVRP